MPCGIVQALPSMLEEPISVYEGLEAGCGGSLQDFVNKRAKERGYSEEAHRSAKRCSACTVLL